jgi:galactose-1-phosphate uridylyltransferase
VTALQRLLGELSYNLLLRLPPTAEPNAFPWLLDVVPRTGQFAGFELLTDTDIITTAPETAATQLRDVVEWTKADGNEESLWPPDYQWV